MRNLNIFLTVLLICSNAIAQNDLKTFDLNDPREYESKWVGIVEPQCTDLGNLATSLCAMFSQEGTLVQLGSTREFHDKELYSVERDKEGRISAIISNAEGESILRKVFYTYDEYGNPVNVKSVWYDWQGTELTDRTICIERIMDIGKPKGENVYKADGTLYAAVTYRNQDDEYNNWTSRTLISKNADLCGKKEFRTITYNSSRFFNFNPAEITVALGDEVVAPKLEGDIADIGYGGNTFTYTSSDEHVAVVGNEGKVTVTGTGSTVITIHVPASVNTGAGEYGEGKASYTLHVIPFTIQGSTETVTLTEAGTLRMALSDLESTEVGSLTLKGPVNGSDLLLLNQHTGRLSNLQVLDMSGVTLVPDNVCYASWYVRSDIGMGGSTYKYYLSSDERVTSSSSPTGLGGGNYVENHYTMELAALFSSFTSLRCVSLPAEVKTVGPHMFSGCTSLFSVILPEGITEVGEAAFSGCKVLAKANFGQLTTIGESAFSETALTSIDLCRLSSLGKAAFSGSALKDADLSLIDSIPVRAFDGCTGFTKVKFCDSLKDIGEAAFRNTALETLSLPEGVRKIGYEAFAGSKVATIEVPSSLLSINYRTFHNTPWEDSQLKNAKHGDIIYLGNIAYSCLYYSSGSTVPETLVFRDGTVAISEDFAWSFYNNQDNIKSLVLPSSIKWIGGSGSTNSAAFSGLTSLTLPEGIEHIGERIFANSKITSVTIPEGVTELCDYAFNGSSLVRVNYNARHAVGLGAFAGCEAIDKVIIGPEVEYLQQDIFTQCKNLLKVEFTGRTPSVNAKSLIGEKTSSEAFTPLIIGDNAFNNCSMLSVCQIPCGTTSIGNHAFSSTALTTANIPYGVRYIGNEAFAFTPLTNICIPSTTETMSGRAFLDCQKVREIYNYMREPYQFDNDGHYFKQLSTTAKLYVWSGLLYVYDTDPLWTAFNIYAMDDENVELSIDKLWQNTDKPIKVYNLQGVEVQYPEHGIYIINGKKVKM